MDIFVLDIMKKKRKARAKDAHPCLLLYLLFILFSLVYPKLSQKNNMSKLTPAKKKIVVALAPKLFAFGGGTKPVSQLLFNKYDTDNSG